MTDIKISALPTIAQGSVGVATDSIPITQGAVTYKVTPTALVFSSINANSTGSGSVVLSTNPVINAPTGIVKADVGLSDVDNTSDASKNAATATLTNKTLTSPVVSGGTVDGAVIGGAVPAAGSFTRVIGVNSFQSDYITAGLESQAATGDAIVSLHAAGTSAAAIRHVRGTSGVRITGTGNGSSLADLTAAAGSFTSLNTTLNTVSGSSGVLGGNAGDYQLLHTANVFTGNASRKRDWSVRSYAGSDHISSAYQTGYSVDSSWDTPSTARTWHKVIPALGIQQWGDQTSTQMSLDASGNLGLGVTPSAWGSYYKAIESGSVGTIALASANENPISLYSNAYGTNSAEIYTTSGGAAKYSCSAVHGHKWHIAPYGIAGQPISWTQAMTLDASGNLLVGQTAADYTNLNSVAIMATGGYVVGNHLLGSPSGQHYGAYAYNGVNIGSITQSGTTAVLYNTTSDARLKTNVVEAPDAASLIDAIQVRSFDWKSDNSHQRYGFVAQELYEVAPEAVSKPSNPDEMMAVDYSKLVPMLVKEIQSLRARVAALEPTPYASYEQFGLS
jgi:hypothetical protein